MGATPKRGYYFPASTDTVRSFPSANADSMAKLDTDMDTALTGPVAASRVSGALAAANIPNLPASKTTSGTFAAARLPAATTSAQGAISAADKKLIDSASMSGSADPGSIVLRTTGSHISVPSNPTEGYHSTSKTYVDNALAAAAGRTITEIPDGLPENDLNLYETTGLFQQSGTAGAQAGNNYPVAVAGLLEVFALGNFVYQRYTAHGTSARVYARERYTTNWYAWREVTGGTGGGGGWTPPDWVDGTIPDTAKMNANTKAKIRANGDGTATVVVSGGLGTAFSPANESEESFQGAIEFPYSAAYAPAFDAKSFVPVTGFDELFNSVTIQFVAGVQKTGTTSVRINLTRPPTAGSMQGQLVGFSITYLV